MSKEKVFLTQEDKIEGVIGIVRDILSAGNVCISITEKVHKDKNCTDISVWKGIELTATKVSTPKLEKITVKENGETKLHIQIPTEEALILENYFSDYNDLIFAEAGERPFDFIYDSEQERNYPYRGGYTHENNEKALEYTE